MERYELMESRGAEENRYAAYCITVTDDLKAERSWKLPVHEAVMEMKMKIIHKAMVEILKLLDGC